MVRREIRSVMTRLQNAKNQLSEALTALESAASQAVCPPVETSASASSSQIGTQAAVDAEADGFIRALPDQYQTRIGERGQRLSGGQRQRLCIARALVKDPPVLILDEATSAVDNETEAAIQRSLKRIAVGRTVVIIAHRLSTVIDAQAIVVLHQGVVAETGTHRELLAAGGRYAALWQAQQQREG